MPVIAGGAGDIIGRCVGRGRDPERGNSKRRQDGQQTHGARQARAGKKKVYPG